MSARRRLAPLVALAFLVGAAHDLPPGNVIRVKGVHGDTVIALVGSPSGGLVPVAQMARLLGGRVDSIGPDQWRLVLYEASVELQAGAPFAGYNGFVLPLLEATRVVDGEPHVALQLFSEIIPRFAIGILWDRTRWEVRLFQGIARQPNAVAAEANAPPTPVTVASSSGPPPPTPVPTPAPARATPATRPTAPAAAPPPARRVGANGLARSYTVAVDPGHGGRDPGNLGVVLDGRRVTEKQLTLALSLELERALRSRGINVLMTRRTDTLIARDDRGPIANGRKADVFVSIHTNAAHPSWRNGSAVRGFETYFLSAARTEDERRVASMENDVVRFETETAATTTKGDPLSFILNDLAQNEHLRESSDLAAVIQRRLDAPHPGPNRGVKQAGFAVLATAYMPAVLVEVGFGSNPADARLMLSRRGQELLAAAIADAIVEYLQHYERRTQPAP